MPLKVDPCLPSCTDIAAGSSVLRDGTSTQRHDIGYGPDVWTNIVHLYRPSECSALSRHLHLPGRHQQQLHCTMEPVKLPYDNNRTATETTDHWLPKNKLSLSPAMLSSYLKLICLLQLSAVRRFTNFAEFSCKCIYFST